MHIKVLFVTWIFKVYKLEVFFFCDQALSKNTTSYKSCLVCDLTLVKRQVLFFTEVCWIDPQTKLTSTSLLVRTKAELRLNEMNKPLLLLFQPQCLGRIVPHLRTQLVMSHTALLQLRKPQKLYQPLFPKKTLGERKSTLAMPRTMLAKWPNRLPLLLNV